MVSENKNRWVGFIGIVVSAIAIVQYYAPQVIPRMVAYSYAAITYPLLRIQEDIILPAKNVIHPYLVGAAAVEALHKEQELNQHLRARLIELQAQVDFYGDIQELVEFRRQFDEIRYRVVKIISRHISEREHYMLIDHGSMHGITSDMVVVYKNCLLGRVSELYPLYSKVTLVTDRSCKIAAYCSATKASGIHVGTNSALAHLQRVNHLSDVNPGDLIISSGEGLIFPQGFAIGTIENVVSDGLYKIAEVVPCIDVSTIGYCAILHKGLPQAHSGTPLRENNA